MALKLLLDANFLMLPAQRGIDVFDELFGLFNESYGLVTLSTVVHELEGISASPGRDASAAAVALKLIEDRNVQVVECTGTADESIQQYALQNKGKVVVCTNDQGLKSSLRTQGIGVVCMRGKDRLIRV
jgi:rRNA-processing protein FCF1